MMNEATQFNELRKWLASEMKDEAQASGKVNLSDDTRMRAMAKAMTYNRVMQKMDEIEAASASALLPCPFCGGFGNLCFERHDIGDWQVECQGCGAVSCPDGMRYDKQQAIDDWNTRYTNK